MDTSRYTLPKVAEYPEITLEEFQRNYQCGSFCTVSMARTIPDGKLVAVKRAKTAIALPPVFESDHPEYVPRTFYRNNDGRGGSITIEEWVNGETLIEYFAHCEDGANAIRRIAIQLLIILRDLVCKRHIYHADLTPRNILAEALGESLSLKLIDFDPWYAVDSYGNVKATNISGSIPFIPPEYLLGGLFFNAEQATVYCAGAVLHYLQFGYPPYCFDLEKGHIERLMYGPKNLEDSAAAAIQRSDYLFFCERIKSGRYGPIFTHMDPFIMAIKLMLSSDPASRPKILNLIRLFEEREK